MSEYVPFNVFTRVVTQVEKKLDKTIEHYGAILDSIATDMNALYSKISNVEAYMKKGGAESGFSFYQTLKELSGDVNIYYDPRTGKPGVAKVKGWSLNVDFFGEYDLFSVFGDTGIGAAAVGYIAGSLDGSRPDYTLSVNNNLIGILTNLELEYELKNLEEKIKEYKKYGEEILSFSRKMKNYSKNSEIYEDRKDSNQLKFSINVENPEYLQ